MNFVTLARVSSREQEREGYSLEAQNKAMTAKARREGWKIVKEFSFHESAKKSENRKKFKEMVDFVKKSKGKVEGILFHKTDRAARNLQDYLTLDNLGVKIKFVNEDYPENAAGRLSFGLMVLVARYYIENLREEVLKGMDEKAEQGWFPGLAPYGYKNIRLESGEAIIVPDPEEAPRVVQIFKLFAAGRHTLDTLAEQLLKKSICYTASQPRFPRSTLHAMLGNTFYVGRFRRNGQELQGKHEPLVPEAVFQKVQKILSRGTYQSLDLPYADSLITCKHCGAPITGERKTKKTKAGTKTYDYYRCARYNKNGHDKEMKLLRIPGAELEKLLYGVVEAVQIKNPKAAEWFCEVLRATNEDDGEQAKVQMASLKTRQSKLDERLRQARIEQLDGEMSRPEYYEIRAETEADLAKVKDEIERLGASNHENHALGLKVFELAQSLPNQFQNANPETRRRFLEILCLNCEFDGERLYPTYRKPFCYLAEGNGRGDRI